MSENEEVQTKEDDAIELIYEDQEEKIEQDTIRKLENREEQKKEVEYIKLKEWEEKFKQEQELKEQDELRSEQKFKERELRKKEIYNNQDLEVSTSTLENLKMDKTSQN